MKNDAVAIIKKLIAAAQYISLIYMKAYKIHVNPIILSLIEIHQHQAHYSQTLKVHFVSPFPSNLRKINPDHLIG